jgi:hypothetical protein
VANPCRTLTGFPILPTAVAARAPKRRHVCCCAEHSTQMTAAREAILALRATSLVRSTSQLGIGSSRSRRFATGLHRRAPSPPSFPRAESCGV